MNFSELGLILLVAILAFSPKKVPMLARHLALLVGTIGRWQQQVSAFWQQQLDEQQLQDNQDKAEKVDKVYEGKNG